MPPGTWPAPKVLAARLYGVGPVTALAMTCWMAAEVARLVRDRCRDWPGFRVVREQPGAAPTGPDRTAGSEADGCGGQVLLLCGPAGVGKSTIGFQLYLRCVRAGLTAGYIDLDQIGFLTLHPDRVIHAITGSRPRISRVSGGPTTLPEPGTS